MRPVTLGVAEPFTITITVCATRASSLALPIVLWQLWSFFAPAVEARFERKLLVLVACSVALAAAGVAFGYEILAAARDPLPHELRQGHFNNLIQASRTTTSSSRSSSGSS